jgi:subtilase family serine protease
MRSHRVILLAATLLAVVTSLSVGTAQAAAAPSRAGGSNTTAACSHSPQSGFASCLAEVRNDVRPMTAQQAAAPLATVSGLGPAQLVSAYNLPSATAGSGQTIAIVDAMDDPTADADLGTYRSQFGLSPCTTANGCFRKVNQNGAASPLPATDSGWALEISLDLDMASAICPNCHILLVEASSASFANLGTAVNQAASLGANAISNSYGGNDQRDATNSPYNHPGIAVTASSGDSGFGVEYPASSRFVTAVGGTTLTSASNGRGWTETAWNGAGSGCSRFNTQIAGQASANTGCRRRATADVSAIADPNTGVAVFDSTPFQNQSGWFVVGGTSVSSPIIAGVYALAGNAASVNNSFPYSHTSALFDVTSGSNGSCNPSQLCTARAGWDGPTGLGTPNGTGAF